VLPPSSGEKSNWDFLISRFSSRRSSLSVKGKHVGFEAHMMTTKKISSSGYDVL
jgi:hypothetical protein